MTNKLTALLAGTATALALSACAYTPTLVTSPNAGNEPPALDQQRITKVTTEANAAAQAGDGARDWQQLASRFMNPAMGMRNGEYLMTNTTRGANLGALPLANPQVAVVQQASDWPRYAYTVSPSVEGQPLYVFGFVQSSPRANYALWGYTKLFPKASFPATFKPEVGSPRPPADSKDFVVVPRALAKTYADYLNDPNSAKDVFETENDSFAATFAQRRTDYATLSQQSRGLEVTMAARPGADGCIALGTTDGGALVMATLNYDVTMKSPRKLQLSALAKAHTGKATAASTLTETHTVVVLFNLPDKASKNRKITVLGASDAVTAMSAD
ncbi:hypothetical protein [uncultured Mobiluncus sp.]|uniref:hypothetical protein n=1 Tax=uncultured Mobiluncus sp. TaxID=293425 RepID=UPI00262A8BCD|nr:hypothetical protein [uncultured Mobiluncus sp.]